MTKDHVFHEREGSSPFSRTFIFLRPSLVIKGGLFFFTCYEDVNDLTCREKKNAKQYEQQDKGDNILF